MLSAVEYTEVVAELDIDREARSLVAEIEATGFGVIPNFVSPSALNQARDFVAGAVQKSSGAYVGFNGPQALSGSGLDLLGRSNRFKALTDRIYELGTGLTPPAQEYYQVLRCLTGHSAATHSYVFHYDSYVLTVLLPIEIPTNGQAGDLLMLPNTRRIRSNYARNFVDKVLLDNKITQWVLRQLHGRGWLPVTRLHLVPGSAYFFWGYRSVHTNEPCDVGSVRATALFHFANPHAESALYKRRRAYSSIPA